MGGEAYKSIADIFHISEASARRVTRKFVEAVLDCDALKIDLPKEEELPAMALAFDQLSSTGDVCHGAVGMIDGLLSARTQPRSDECSNPADYYSGHYRTFGLNIQALCDADLRFRYVAVSGPGKLNDIRAYKRCDELIEWINNLPNEYFLIGDNACPLSNKMLTPLHGDLLE